jgi:hypothetical protein
VIVKAKGENLPPLPVLPLTLPVRAQMQTANGACWEAEFLASGVMRNDALKFKGKPG